MQHLLPPYYAPIMICGGAFNDWYMLPVQHVHETKNVRYVNRVLTHCGVSTFGKERRSFALIFGPAVVPNPMHAVERSYALPHSKLNSSSTNLASQDLLFCKGLTLEPFQL